jgi:hypothetical protein
MNGNPLSPDSQAFMDLLERHLEEHDATGQTQTMPAIATNFSGVLPATAYQPFPAKGAANAPSPNTMAALINILQVQAQAQGLDPQAHQRQLAALLGNMPITGGMPGQQSTVYPNVQPSQLYAPATGYPYPGVDTPEHSSSSGPGSAPKHPASGTESNGNTPPQARAPDPSSSPDARAPGDARRAVERSRRAVEDALEAQARKRLDAEKDADAAHVKRKAGDEEMEGHMAHRSRHVEEAGSEGDGESVY